MVVTLLFQQMLKMFIIIIMGFLLVRSKILTAHDSKVLSVTCVYVVLPCVIVHAFQIPYDKDTMHAFLLSIYAAFSVHILLFFITWIIGKTLDLDVIERNSIIYSNSGNLIIPLVVAIFGEEWVIYASGFMVVQSLFIWTHATCSMSNNKSFSLYKICSNINLIAVFLGFILFYAQIQLPEIIDDALAQVAVIVGPVSMLVIGMILGGADVKKVLSDMRLYMVTFLKMFLVPLLILLFLRFSGLSTYCKNGDTIIMITALAVIAPTASLVTQLAQIYDRRPEYAGTINIMTTLISIMSMPALLYLYEVL